MAAAIVAGAVSLIVAVVTTLATFRAQERRLRYELRTQFMAEEAIHLLLQNERWKQRSFEAIRRHVGGFDDDSLRQLLVRAGALRFEDKDGRELWGLRERNLDRLS
jgi:hypothetical protein